MRISIFGTGYVGLVTGACLADVGHHVMCVDIDAEKVSNLKQGIIPIFEPGLSALVESNLQSGQLQFSTSPEEGVAFGSVLFIAVGTPQDEDGSADLQYVLNVAEAIGRHMEEHRFVINKSTVPVGTADKVRARIGEVLAQRGERIEFDVISNPEFLKEGAAVSDFMRPDRIVIGADSQAAIEKMRELYAPFNRNHDRMMLMDVRSAEFTKYAANAMLATRISFMNELANLADTIGADIESVRRGIGSDPRIGYHFLYAGCGYGGSCFPKDVKALIKTAEDHGHNLKVLNAVERVNESQKHVLTQKIKARFGEDLTGRHFALWGLAFKPETDDMREAPSRTLIAGLLGAGATITAYDPVAMPETRRIFVDDPRITLAESPFDALDREKPADALVIVTEWKEFRVPNFGEIRKRLKAPVIFDGRNLYEPRKARESGIDYYAIGRGNT